MLPIVDTPRAPNAANLLRALYTLQCEKEPGNGVNVLMTVEVRHGEPRSLNTLYLSHPLGLDALDETLGPAGIVDGARAECTR